MARSISRTEKRSRGRPRKDPTSIHVTLLPVSLAALDAWIEHQSEPRPSRPEAIRRLLEQAFAGKGGKQLPSKEAARKASKLAARELEKRGSPSLPEPDLQQRKRTLIRGPKEFREIRADLPKPKS
jgi:hypothetical protein